MHVKYASPGLLPLPSAVPRAHITAFNGPPGEEANNPACLMDLLVYSLLPFSPANFSHNGIPHKLGSIQERIKNAFHTSSVLYENLLKIYTDKKWSRKIK